MLSSHIFAVHFSNYSEHRIGQTGFLSFQYQIWWKSTQQS